MKRIVINLFGAPASGKSTCAAYIFSQLKMRGVNAELITEFAKDKVWEGNMEVFKPENQCYLFGEQFYKMNCCKGKVDVIVTDSPLPLNILYNKSKILGKDFDRVVMSCFNSFNNISPDNPLSKKVLEYSQSELKTIPWTFQSYPSDTFKDLFGAALVDYTKGSRTKDDVKNIVIGKWKSEKS